jgi:hypothetical protein
MRLNLRIKFTSNTSTLLITVIDTGKDIARDDQPRFSNTFDMLILGSRITLVVMG